MNASTARLQAGSTPFADLPRRVASCMHLLRMRHRDRRAAAGLQSLSDATLRDIGLQRTEVPTLIHAPGAGRRRSWHVEG